ncbi:MAG TPA: arginine N-succinyltransferase [Pseudomonadales bacterium]
MGESATGGGGFSGRQVLLFILVAVILAAGLTFWFVRTYLYASPLEPVALSQKEQRKLDDKLVSLGLDPVHILPDAKRSPDRFDADGRLIAERYSEQGASRRVRLTEKELNALVASSPELASRFAIDLSQDLASAKLLIPVDPDFPVLGGKTIRVTAGLELDYREQRPVVILRGVSVMGVPVPNAWLGNLKNVDLVREFGGRPGFWQSFSAGIETIAIEDGRLLIELKE